MPGFDEGHGFDRQVYAWYLEQGGWFVPSKGYFEPCFCVRVGRLSKVVACIGYRSLAATRLQAEAYSCQVFGTDCKATRHRLSKDCLCGGYGVGNANMPAMAEGAIISKMADRGQLGNVIVDGPLSLDVALFKEVAEHKKVKGSAVAGDVDGLLFPNIESGNVFFKSVSHLAGGELAAVVMGAKVPCVLTSRGDSAASKKYSIALASLLAK